jgi:hypothetical protein
MVDRRALASRATACGVGILLGCTLPLAANAQTPIDELATDIKQQFGANGYYKSGQLGNDWCFNVDKESGSYTWWYYDLVGDGSGPTAHQITNTARIQATYTDANGATKYASVFLGLDLSAANPPVPAEFATFDSLPDKIMATAPKRPQITTGNPKPMAPAYNPPLSWPPFTLGDSLTVPSHSATSSCMTLGDFLKAYTLPFSPVVTSPISFLWDKASFTGTYAFSRFWVFNGRPHTIVNVLSYAIALQDTGNNTYSGVNLVVGIGGGAGP